MGILSSVLSFCAYWPQSGDLEETLGSPEDSDTTEDPGLLSDSRTEPLTNSTGLMQEQGTRLYCIKPLRIWNFCSRK